MMMKNVREVSDLVGEEISAVCFVRDYVEFHFDGPILRSLLNPIVCHDGVECRFPEAGSRDALCKLIGAVVHCINLQENHALKITMSDNLELIISLDASCGEMSEVMHFVPKINGPIQVW